MDRILVGVLLCLEGLCYPRLCGRAALTTAQFTERLARLRLPL